MITRSSTIFVLAMMSILSFVPKSHSECKPLPEATRLKSVVWGTGVLKACKSFHFMRFHGEPKDQLEINCDDKKFDEMVQWFDKNIFWTINTKPIITTESTDFLFLYSQQFPFNGKNPSDSGDFMLDIPLNQDTLGPDFQSKINELRGIMKVCKSNKNN